jgi:hypothetical protein
MALLIDDYHNRSLTELEIVPNRLVVFGNCDPDSGLPPFLFVVPKEKLASFSGRAGYLHLSFKNLNDQDSQEFELRPYGYAIGLYGFEDGKPSYEKYFDHSDIPGGRYVIEFGFVPDRGIHTRISQSKAINPEAYYRLLNQRKFICERTSIERIVESLGLGFLLPNPIRFID